MQYYDLEKNWSKVGVHLDNKKVKRALIRDMNLLFNSRWHKQFEWEKGPRYYEVCCWEDGEQFRSRKYEPLFWRFTLYAACHWLVNFNLELAKLVLPNEPWRIVKSKKHSTVWNGNDLLFEFNLQAFGVSADVCFEEAYNYGRVLKPGRQRKCHKLEFWLEEIAREKKQCEVEGRVFVPHG